MSYLLVEDSFGCCKPLDVGSIVPFDGCMTCNFTSFSIIFQSYQGDCERLCAVEPHLQLKSSLPQARLQPWTLDQ